MAEQLDIHFPLFSPELFEGIRKRFVEAERETEKTKEQKRIEELENKIDHLNHRVAGFISGRVKRNKNKNTQ
jgi:hypothetical protein